MDDGAARERLRRSALARQGLTQSSPFGRGVGGVASALAQLGYVQIDTISVVARAHHHTLWNRVPGYRPALLDQLVEQRGAFEYWFHAASFLPIDAYRYALPRMQTFRQRWRNSGRTVRKHERLVLDRIRAEGPLSARDFVDANHRSRGWWDWKPAKQALERLYLKGDLMVSGRTGFQKRYDLPERVLPAAVDTTMPTPGEYAGYLIDTCLKAHGVATLPQFTYLRRGASVRTAVKARLHERLRSGAVSQLRLAGMPPLFADSTLLDDKPRKPPARVRLLSPFDNAVILRDRNQFLHDFDYQIECYVPAAKRRYGYFCLPVLFRDRLVGRVDCKAHRAESRLELIHLHMERDVADADEFASTFIDAARRFAEFNQCTELSLTRTSPPHWQSRLRNHQGS